MSVVTPGYGLREMNFGTEAPFALGVEEELLLVGSDNELLDRGRQALRNADPDEGSLTEELFQAMVESNTDVSRNAREATDVLRNVRAELIDSGSRIMGVGVHPNAASWEAAVAPSARYALIAHSLQGVLRTPICGLHVHVGMPDVRSAVRAYNGIRTHVPLLNALASNSPYWFGEDSGLASSRTAIFRSYPRAAMAPEISDFEDYRRIVGQVCRAGQLEDYTHIWWDARLHPALGTIEIRAADAQFDLRRVGAIAALVQCLARIEADRSQRGIPAREALAEASFQATRHGLDAILLDRTCEPIPARALGSLVLEQAATVASEFDCEAELAELEVILDQGSAADLQRRIYATGGMGGLLAYLVRETAEPHERQSRPD
jgi:glutamate---cysteine ligase / carboxylate-amine ligase